MGNPVSKNAISECGIHLIWKLPQTKQHVFSAQDKVKNLVTLRMLIIGLVRSGRHRRSWWGPGGSIWTNNTMNKYLDTIYNDLHKMYKIAL